MNTDDPEQDEQTVPDDETTEDRDQGEQSSRLSTDRDDPEAGPEIGRASCRERV